MDSCVFQATNLAINFTSTQQVGIFRRNVRKSASDQAITYSTVLASVVNSFINMLNPLRSDPDLSIQFIVQE